MAPTHEVVLAESWRPSYYHGVFRFLTFLFGMLSLSGLAQEQAVPTRRIEPEDIVHDSVQLVRLSTNAFAVRFTYTEAGAAKMLAFREAHEGQPVRIVVGRFQFPRVKMEFRSMPPDFSTYAQWKEGWLQRRTDKFWIASEEDAKKIVDGLKGN